MVSSRHFVVLKHLGVLLDDVEDLVVELCVDEVYARHRSDVEVLARDLPSVRQHKILREHSQARQLKTKSY